MLAILVQNYFERNGSFDGIENTAIYDVILRNLKETGESKEELCYRLLGYSGSDSSVNLMKLRQDLMNDVFNSQYATKELNVGHKPYFKTCKKPVNYQEVNQAKKEKMAGIDKLLAAYYKNDVYNLIEEENGTQIPFGLWLNQMSKENPSKLVDMPNVQKCLAKFEVSEQDDAPTIYGGVLYFKESFSEKEQRQLHINALKQLFFSGTPMKSWCKIPLGELIVLSTARPEEYLKMMDYAIAIGKTYADLMLELGIQIPDLIMAYELTGYPFFTLNNRIMYFSNERKNWCITSVGAFEYMCSSEECQNPLETIAMPEKTVKYVKKPVGGVTSELRSF